MLIREDKLRMIIRESLLDDAQNLVSKSYAEFKGVIDDTVALAKLHPTVGLVFDVSELSAEIYDIVKDTPNVGNIKNMSKEELKRLQKEQADKMINLIGEKVADFVIEKMVLGQIDKIDAVLELTFDTNTKEVVKVACSEKFRKSLLAVLADLFTQLGRIPEKVIDDMEETMTRVYTNAVNSFKISDKPKYNNITKMHSRYQKTY